MNRLTSLRIAPIAVLAALLALFAITSPATHAADPRVIIDTSKGQIEVELLSKMSPRTVANFLELVDAEFYDGLIFHRVIANFMIQGGGLTPEMKQRQVDSTVPNESFNGVPNRRGTLAMARLTDPDSASTEFFINVKDNAHLDALPGQPGYTVFGRVSAGMEVVEDIELVNTHLFKGFAAVPEEPIIINSIRRLD